ncbi:MAG: hypothetical protein QCI38_08630, partial [Candidatus Thermoplasmatota archaeon]|nr:hypothetical protein [Candidatus Thermoplasmatota archaeon]
CNVTTATRVMEAVNETVFGYVCGTDYIYGEHPDAHGIHIYLPYRSTEYLVQYDNVSFSQDTLWDEFIKAIYLS